MTAKENKDLTVQQRARLSIEGNELQRERQISDEVTAYWEDKQELHFLVVEALCHIDDVFDDALKGIYVSMNDEAEDSVLIHIHTLTKNLNNGRLTRVFTKWWDKALPKDESLVIKAFNCPCYPACLSEDVFCDGPPLGPGK